MRLRAISGCDGVMLGRGALGNPWIYREVAAVLEGRVPPPAPDLAQRKRVVLRHIELQCRYDHQPLGHLRRIICWYFKDLPGVAEFRNRIHHAQHLDELTSLVETYQS